jgi:predicted nucleic acid-binding protein
VSVAPKGLKWLIDTNVVSDPKRARPNAGCVQWLRDLRPATAAISAISLAEIWQGVKNLAPEHGRFAELGRYARKVPEMFFVLPFDAVAAETWGEITRKGLSPLPVRDSFIAAIALSRNLTVVTRDESPFKQAGCRTLNPFEE